MLTWIISDVNVNLADVIGGWSQLLSFFATVGAIIVAARQLKATREQIKQSEIAMLEQIRQAEEQQKLTQEQLEQIKRAEMPEAVVFFDHDSDQDKVFHIDLFNVKRAPVYVQGFVIEIKNKGEMESISHKDGFSHAIYNIETSADIEKRPVILNQGDSFRITLKDACGLFDKAGLKESKESGVARVSVRIVFITPFAWNTPFIEFKAKRKEKNGVTTTYYVYSTDGKAYYGFLTTTETEVITDSLRNPKDFYAETEKELEQFEKEAKEQ